MFLHLSVILFRGVWSHFLSGYLVPFSFGGVCLLRRYGTPPLVLTSSGSHQSRWCASYWNALLLEHKNRKLQECIPVGCVPPTHYHSGGLCLGALPFSPEDPPGRRPPWTETPRTKTQLNRDPPDRDRPGQRPPRQRPPGQITAASKFLSVSVSVSGWLQKVSRNHSLLENGYGRPSVTIDPLTNWRSGQWVNGYRRSSVTIF